MKNNSSKINRILSIVTILLLVAIILILLNMKKVEDGKNDYVTNQTKVIQDRDVKWIPSPSSEFGSVVLYPSDWQIMPINYASAAQQVRGEEYIVGYGFTLPSGSIITWGGPQAGCNDNEFGEFKYNVSSLTCLKGSSVSIGRVSAREVLSSSDLKLFGDFILKNR